MPEIVEGETFARTNELFLVFQMWSSFREYKLVPSETGKLPMVETRPTYDAGSGALLVGKKLAGKPGVFPKSATAEVVTPRLYIVTRSETEGQGLNGGLQFTKLD